MKLSLIRTVAFYLALAGCLWPLFVQGAQVVNYIQLASRAHQLAQIPPTVVLVAIVQTALLLWAISAAVVLFRKGQDSFAWLLALLILVPLLGQIALQRA